MAAETVCPEQRSKEGTSCSADQLFSEKRWKLCGPVRQDKAAAQLKLWRRN